MICVSRLTVYPIKSLDGVDVSTANVLPSGALENDRRFAAMDAEGKFVNGKRTAAIHAVRAEYDLAAMHVTLQSDAGTSSPLSMIDQRPEIADWLSEATGRQSRIAENAAQGMPDDTDASGPTLVSTQTLAAIAEWYRLPLDECRRRLRANVEIDCPQPFWEDRLVGGEFSIGPVRFTATGVCQRCVVPARDSRSGDLTVGFQARFAQMRADSLPAESPRDAFNHFYRVAINTRLAGSPGTIAQGDKLTADSTQSTGTTGTSGS